MKEKAVLLFSGGIDSTTALYWGMNHFSEIQALIFFYSQRHSIEVKMAEKMASNLKVIYHKIELPLKNLVDSALIDNQREIPASLSTSRDNNGIPFTYVPFRNGIFLSIASAYAESRKIFNLLTGFNVIDTPDYPDTTEEFVKKMEAVINQGTSATIIGKEFKIHTPLLKKNKKEIIELGLKLGSDYSYSVSCYRGNEVPCLSCPACEIRMNAFEELNKEDPLIRRLKEEGKL